MPGGSREETEKSKAEEHFRRKVRKNVEIIVNLDIKDELC